MIALIGHICLLIAVLLFAGFIFWNSTSSKKLPYIGHGLVISAFICLLVAFITSDFSLQNVFLNSSTIKPLIYKIAGSWSSHEGSMLLWLSLLSLVSIYHLSQSGKNPLYIIAQKIIALIETLFIIVLYFTADPFKTFNFRAIQGVGLNPMLQDVALAFHPPILYLGQVLLIIPFVISCSLLIKHKSLEQNNKLLKEYLYNCRTFCKIALLFLTLGIGLGSWWAYRELGWGGFWFFDPVENISLMPWLVAICLHHILLKSTINLQVIVFSILPFLLIILGMFLVRSGILMSVHSFAFSVERGIGLLIIFSLVATTSIGLLAFNGHALISSQSYEAYKNNPKNLSLSRIFNSIDITKQAINFTNIFWIISLVVLLFSIFYPIIYQIIYQDIITIEVNYFTYLFIPLLLSNALIAAIITGVITPFLVKKQFFYSIIFTAIFTAKLIYFLRIKEDFIMLMGILVGMFLIVTTFVMIVSQIRKSGWSISTNFISMNLAHTGFGLLILAISLNVSLQKEFTFIGKINQTKNFGQFEVTLKDIRVSEYDNYYQQVVELWLHNLQNGEINILTPATRWYIIEKTLSQESDIYSYLTHDLYAVLDRVEGKLGNNIVHAQIYYRPMISFIWLSISMIAVGFVIKK